ncbi:alpha/beta hydrolase family protein [Mesonia ostreae]|uniref:Dienelactone hydrolase family protein n=1 Tax=Mesonia ostreae TaxID=861110 RepID=A0ABU2KHE7_9FLAO|nr:alpha/beta fold hydrolase [Mesonia ostreae]MDT0294137.1 dienelactone hydrolase family protein [Mesonia ostreae]
MIREKNFTLTGSNGLPIVTDVFFKPNQSLKPIVIFCHGYKGFKDWGAWDLVAENFAENDFFFIKFNFSHNGGTAEEPIDFPNLEAFGQDNYTKQLNDLQTVIDWIATTKEFSVNANVQKVHLIGHSRGGGIVMLKANEEPKITSVTTWAGVSDFASRFPSGEKLAQWKKDKVYYVENGRTKQQMPHDIQFYEDFLEHRERLDIAQAVKHLKIPQLIIHGKGDTSVKVDEAKQIKEWNPKSKLFLLEGSNHVFDTKHPWESDKMNESLRQVTHETMQFIKNN